VTKSPNPLKPLQERSEFERRASGGGICFERRNGIPYGQALLPCSPTPVMAMLPSFGGGAGVHAIPPVAAFRTGEIAARRLNSGAADTAVPPDIGGGLCDLAESHESARGRV
jgi:hypothetical protein